MASDQASGSRSTRLNLTEGKILALARRRETTKVLALLGYEEVQRSSRLRKAVARGLNPARTGVENHDWAVRQALMELVLNDPDGGVRTVAMNALAVIGEREDVPFFTRMLQEGDVRVKIYAARGLGKSHANEAVAPLRAALADRKGSVRDAAAQALATIGDGSAIPDIEAAVKRTWHPFWRAAIKSSLREFR